MSGLPSVHASLPARFDVTVHPVAALRGTLHAQPSKNYTTRYLLAAALAEGPTRVHGVATSEDAEALLRCLRDWGAHIALDGEDALVTGFGAHPRPGVTLNPGNAGAVARFLMAVALLTQSTTLVTDYAESLGKRPQGDLLEALHALGATVTSTEGRLPVTVSGPVVGGPVQVSAERSSQYASGLMFAAPLLPNGLDLHLTGDVKSHAPLRQTLQTLRTFGVTFTASADLTRVTIPGGQTYRAPGGAVRVPGDYPGSAAILAAAAVRPGEVRVLNLLADDLQGERAAVDVLRDMGAQVWRDGDSVVVQGGAPLRALTRDGDAFTDAVQALTAAAASAQGVTTWENVATLRLKECDRISDTRAALASIGVHATETHDSLSVTGAAHIPGGVIVDGYGDHRMIMMLTLLGLRADAPITVTGAHHVRKSYPGFFAHLEALGATFEYHAR
ncbi:3-phosphoshikimate 1-carboxyvinyltransferase [Deinococcus maricopensis]|uniref:3-phosphoshikimate 1-carboxyvinyltransferase n=1 Tax=Deinococcus maricopensis (strain DSM 21211 / LMG 22137 / NRRL B-23946 / LB-34) TaxID=709986 RepID=E8U670_DEIML|nr:3-phosphoshikimate 1-carboxyvinyltransferase [Deinococcus maricopensis]ADV66559.1 3-phosphoshikimate 1-carboxyvinyltransferase [Deinococcus maricopensis DSM 21211]